MNIIILYYNLLSYYMTSRNYYDAKYKLSKILLRQLYIIYNDKLLGFETQTCYSKVNK